MNTNQINPTGFYSPDWRAQSRQSARSPSLRSSPDADFDAGQDRVDLSAEADASETSPAVTAQRIREIRTQIAAGTYLTPDKIDATVERLHEELFGQ